MFFFLSKFLPLFCYPLGLACGLVGAAIVVLGRRPRWARGLLATALGVLWLSSTPWAVRAVVGSLEQPFRSASALETLPPAGAIVILGGATAGALPPRSYPEMGEAGDRVVHGARLYQAGKAPWIVLSGGRVQWQAQGQAGGSGGAGAIGAQPATAIASEAEDMATLLQAWGIPDRALLLETQSLNTRQNALNTAQILKDHQIQQILLVTSALHMPRALGVFQTVGEEFGFEVVPAPTDFWIELPGSLGWSWQEAVVNLLPDADNQQRLSRGLKEWLGFWVYRARGWL
ncbi:MAG: YdcF family protein [Prochlorothrix sp.]